MATPPVKRPGIPGIAPTPSGSLTHPIIAPPGGNVARGNVDGVALTAPGGSSVTRPPSQGPPTNAPPAPGSGSPNPPSGPPGLPSLTLPTLPALPSLPSLSSLKFPPWYHGVRPVSNLAFTIRDGWFALLGDLSQFPYNQSLRTQFGVAASFRVDGQAPPAGWFFTALLYGPTDSKGVTPIDYNAPIIWGIGVVDANGNASWVVNQQTEGVPNSGSYQIDQYYTVVLQLWTPGPHYAGSVPRVTLLAGLNAPIYGQSLALNGIQFPQVELVTALEVTGTVIDTASGQPVANHPLSITVYGQDDVTVGALNVTTDANGNFDANGQATLPFAPNVELFAAVYGGGSQIGGGSAGATNDGVLINCGTVEVGEASGNLTGNYGGGSTNPNSGKTVPPHHQRSP